MTTPIERTRALRMAWEFLWELRSAGHLRSELQRSLERVLEHYPNPKEIDAWARTGQLGFSPSPLEEQWLAPEPTDSTLPSYPSATSAQLDRPPVTPKQRMQCLFNASTLLHAHLRSAGVLTIEQRRQRTAVARHFPIGIELVAMAVREGFKLPFDLSEQDLLRHGKAAFQRTTMNCAVPAQAEMAELDPKPDHPTNPPRL